MRQLAQITDTVEAPHSRGHSKPRPVKKNAVDTQDDRRRLTADSNLREESSDQDARKPKLGEKRVPTNLN
jgi:hypothetical protein